MKNILETIKVNESLGNMSVAVSILDSRDKFTGLVVDGDASDILNKIVNGLYGGNYKDLVEYFEDELSTYMEDKNIDDSSKIKVKDINIVINNTINNITQLMDIIYRIENDTESAITLFDIKGKKFYR